MLIDQCWSLVLSAIIGAYLNESTLCIFWNDKFEFQLLHSSEYTSYVGINIPTLRNNQGQDVVDVGLKKKVLQEKNLLFDDLLIKIIISIEVTHCESFLVFDKDIDLFIDAFNKASVYSIWRSLRNKFIFAHVANELQERWENLFFEDQPNILFVIRDHSSGSSFDLKTNKYVGPKSEKPAQLKMLDTYSTTEQRFQLGKSLFPDKLKDLQGREVVLAGFDYRPYTVIKHNTNSNARDIGVSEDSDLRNVYIDGTETRVVLNFCEKFNCTIEIDTSDANDWGNVYPNMSGDGALGMVINHKADICIGAMYSWSEDYSYLDLSMYLVRSGITCLVPAPMRLASWYLPLEPFQESLWAAILLCLCMETIGLILAYKSEQELYVPPSYRDGWWKCTKFGLSTTFKLLISQSGNSKANSLTVRALLFVCFLNDLIITSIYGGGLASILTVPSMDEAADTVQRLRLHRLQWAANSEAWVSAIRGSDEPLVRDLLNNFHIYNDDRLLRLAQEQMVRIGFTVERLPFGHFAIGNYLVPQAIDQLVIMKDDLYFQYTVAFVPRLWPLLDQFNTLIYNWHSSGFDKYWEYRVVADNLDLKIQQQVEETMSGKKGDIGPDMLGMSNFAGFLLVWILGSTLATLSFFFELLYAKVTYP
nr:uncharacterized protein LOC108054865 [Drosophila takahashii]